MPDLQVFFSTFQLLYDHMISNITTFIPYHTKYHNKSGHLNSWLISRRYGYTEKGYDCFISLNSVNKRLLLGFEQELKYLFFHLLAVRINFKTNWLSDTARLRF